jgi:3-deoxy-D-manno-octulosonic-acid transferase
MYALYSVALALALLASAPYYLWKGRGSGRYLRTLGERLGGPPALPAAGERSIWIHAVSVGEVLVARGLVERLKARFPSRRVVVSTTTATGNAIARSLLSADAVFYNPLDLRGPVRRTLAALDPALLVLVETEIWPNLIHEAHRRGIRVAVANGRLSPRSFPRYARARPLLARVLAEVDVFLMQGEAHADRARRIGAPAERVRVTGNLKYDAPAPGPGEPAAVAMAALLGPAGEARPLWVAGSTMPGEEEAVLRAFGALRAGHPTLRLLIAPRHPARAEDVTALAARSGHQVVRRSALGGAPWRAGDVLVLDTMGELAHVYPHATVVFVGGSLVPSGGHNVLEPAAAGRAVVVGPHMENFQEIADEFRAERALLQVQRAEDLAPAIARLLEDAPERERMGARGRALLERNRGALEATVEALAGLVA